MGKLMSDGRILYDRWEYVDRNFGDAHSLWTTTPDEAAGLRLCLQDGRAMGPGTGRHDEQPAWYLPLRGLQSAQGAALVRHDAADRPADGRLEHAQALCDQLGAALERSAALTTAARAREQAQEHALRNTLLTAISHDHRTPLATIQAGPAALHFAAVVVITMFAAMSFDPRLIWDAKETTDE